MAACPRLTELSVISPYPQTHCQETDTGVSLDSDGRAHSGMFKLTAACKTLQDFNTLQIVHPIVRRPGWVFNCDWGGGRCEWLSHSCLSREKWEELLEKYVGDLREWAIECLEKAKTGCLEGEERKRITLRTVEFGYIHPVKVREYKV